MMRIQKSLPVLLIVFVTCAARAEVTEISVEQVDSRGLLPSHVVNDLSIDFSGRLYGQQLILSLDQGSIFHAATFGSIQHTPPSRSLFPIDPTLEFDTFVAACGHDQETSEEILIVGAAGSLKEGPRPMQFDMEGLDVAWAVSPGVRISDQEDCLCARITLSDDAEGSIRYLGAAAPLDFPYFIQSGVISHGRISFVPEPSSLVLIVFGLLAAAGFRGRGSIALSGR